MDGKGAVAVLQEVQYCFLPKLNSDAKKTGTTRAGLFGVFFV